MVLIPCCIPVITGWHRLLCLVKVLVQLCNRARCLSFYVRAGVCLNPAVRSVWGWQSPLLEKWFLECRCPRLESYEQIEHHCFFRFSWIRCSCDMDLCKWKIKLLMQLSCAICYDSNSHALMYTKFVLWAMTLRLVACAAFVQATALS